MKEYGPFGRESPNSKEFVEMKPEQIQIMKEVIHDVEDILNELRSGFADPSIVHEVIDNTGTENLHTRLK